MASIYDMIVGLGDAYTTARARARQEEEIALARAAEAEVARSYLGGFGSPSAAGGATQAIPGASQPRLPVMAGVGPVGDWARGIQGVESGGNYRAVGPVIARGPYRGDQALGAYQIMGRNLPEWSKAALGREVGRDEFLNSNALQDQIFQHRFGSYVNRYGNTRDAASAWFTGRPYAEAMRAGATDQLGTRVDEYVAKFERGMPKRVSTPVMVASSVDATVKGSDGTPVLAGGTGDTLSGAPPPPPATGQIPAHVRSMLQSGNPYVRRQGIDLANKALLGGGSSDWKVQMLGDRAVLFNERSGGITPLPQFDKASTGPDKTFDTESKLRTEFSRENKNFGDVQDAYARVIGAVQQRVGSPKTESPASDIALVFGYMKMLDPGSVVREGEYATAQNAAGIPTRVQNIYNKLLSGEFLTSEQRQDFVKTAATMYRQAREGAEKTAQRYQGLASQYGVDPARTAALPPALEMPVIAAPPAATPTVTAPAQAAPAAAPPPAAVDHLRQNPGLAAAFDQKYGPGAAARVLGN